MDNNGPMPSDSIMAQTSQVERSWQGCDVFGSQLQMRPDIMMMPKQSLRRCDESFKDQTHAEVTTRYSTVYVRLQSATPAVVGGPLLLAPSPNQAGLPGQVNPRYEFFANGLSEPQNNAGGVLGYNMYSAAPAVGTLLPGEGSPWTLSEADTDGLAPDSSSPNTTLANLTSDENIDYWIGAFSLEVTGFYVAGTQYAANAADGAVIREQPEWIYRFDGEYRKRITEFLQKHAVLNIRRRGEQGANSGPQYRLGPTSDWPSFSEAIGHNSIAAGQPQPFAYRMVTLPFLTGRRPKITDNNLYRISLSLPSNTRFDSSPTNGVPAGLSSTVFAQAPYLGSLWVGVKLRTYGGMVCVNGNGVPIRYQGQRGRSPVLSAIQQRFMQLRGLVPEWAGNAIAERVEGGEMTVEQAVAELDKIAAVRGG